MKKEIADLWTAALRGGKYEQATGQLVRIDCTSGEVVGHCCLGVLCEIAIEQGVDVEKLGPKKEEGFDDDGEIYHQYTDVSFDDSDALLPLSVQSWAGMRSSDGTIGLDALDDLVETLTALNDNGKTFLEIADVIEKHVEEL